VIDAPLLPDFPAQQACGRQDCVAGCGARTMVLPWLGVLASWDNRLCPTLRDRFMTAFGFVGTIAADACDGLVGGNLIEQAWQYRRIACGVVGYFNGPDFQRGRVNA
jgi:hypothetical protein